MDHEGFPAATAIPAARNVIGYPRPPERRTKSKRSAPAAIGMSPPAELKSNTARVTSYHDDKTLLMRLLTACFSLVEAAYATDALLEQYASCADAIAAPFAELRAIGFVGERGARLLKGVQAAAVGLAIVPLQNGTGIGDWPSMRAYLNIRIGRGKKESFLVLFLNAQNHVIADHFLADDLPYLANISVRDIAQQSLQIGARAVLLAHNRPTGSPLPSEDDIEVTQRLESALALLEIRLHDHVIVGKGELFSCKKGQVISG